MPKSSRSNKITANRYYNGQNLAAYNCEFFEMLRYKEGFVAMELFELVAVAPIVRLLYRLSPC
jgi:hypothetical protein